MGSPETHNREDVMANVGSHVSEGLAMLAELMNSPVEVRSEGAYVWDSDGKEYLDCGGYGVFVLGHRHPRVVEAVKHQLDLNPLATRLFLNPVQADAARALAEISPEGLDYVFFTNSGAEAAELGIKLARMNGARRLVATEGGFHGKTNGALSVTGKPTFRDPFEPLLADVTFIPFGDAAALEAELAGSEKSAFIVEPVQGEAGVVIPPDGYLADVERICREHDTFLIVDEIQTGLGRLGTLWGMEPEGITPDAMLVAKGLSGGVMPVGALVATTAAFTGLNEDPMLHSSTYAGNPLAMAAARAAIDTIVDEDIPARARELGPRVKEALQAGLDAGCPDLVTEVRGRGLLVAVEFNEDHYAADFMFELLGNGVIISTSLNTHRIARLHPSAVMSDEDVDRLASALAKSAESIGKRYGKPTAKGAAHASR